MEQPPNGKDKTHHVVFCDTTVAADGQVRRFPLLVLSPLYACSVTLTEKSPRSVTAVLKG